MLLIHLMLIIVLETLFSRFSELQEKHVVEHQNG